MSIAGFLSFIGLIFSGNLPIQSLFTQIPDHVCQPADRNIDCMSRFGPVCALVQGEDCLSGLCYKTKLNACLACTDSSIISYASGSCKSIKEHFCAKGQFESPESCVGRREPICTFYQGDNCPSGICSKTVRNEFAACSDTKTLFYMEGECPSSVMSCENQGNTEESNKNFRAENSRPVIAFYQGGDCTTKVCSRSEESGRKACQDSNVLFYVDNPLEIGTKTVSV